MKMTTLCLNMYGTKMMGWMQVYRLMMILLMKVDHGWLVIDQRRSDNFQAYDLRCMTL